MTSRHRWLHHALGLLSLVCVQSSSAIAATLDFTLTVSEPVTVTGSPRIAVDVGGVTRYADYTAGSGTSTLIFSYTVQAGDFDANGIALVSPLDLNGGSFTDSIGTVATNLSFTAPDTSGIKIQTYTVAFTADPIASASANAVAFTIAKAPIGASFSYTITSSGGAGSVAGSGTIGASPQTVSGIDVTSLSPGTLTLAVIMSTAAGGTGAASQDSATLDSLPPAGYAASFLTSPLNAANSTAASFELSGGEVGASYSFSISSSGGGTAVTGTGTVSADPQQITGLDLSGLGDGTLTLSITLTDSLGNAGSPATSTVAKDTLAPAILSVTPPAAGTYDDL
jgi:hypothetical protein